MEYRLTRFNGRHPSQHTNGLEKKAGNTCCSFRNRFHKHIATERYQLAEGFEIDHYAEVTDEYDSFDKALVRFPSSLRVLRGERPRSAFAAAGGRRGIMNTLLIASSFRDKVCQEIDLESEGVERHIVYTPFRFDDGDHFVVILRRNPTTGLWSLTDEGHTFMHLSYGEVDLTRGTRSHVVEEVLASHGVQNRSGELSIDVPGDAFGDVLFSFVQALSRISTTAQWNREVVRSTFLDDFRQFMEETVPTERREFDFADPTIDPDGNYTVDCRVLIKAGDPGSYLPSGTTLAANKLLSPVTTMNNIRTRSQVSQSIRTRRPLAENRWRS